MVSGVSGAGRAENMRSAHHKPFFIRLHKIPNDLPKAVDIFFYAFSTYIFDIFGGAQ